MAGLFADIRSEYRYLVQTRECLDTESADVSSGYQTTCEQQHTVIKVMDGERVVREELIKSGCVCSEKH